MSAIFKSLFLSIILIISFQAGARNKVIATKESPYGLLYIYEDSEHNKCLAFEDPSHAALRQSCMDSSASDKLIFNYQKMALGALYLQPDPKNILIIGLGGNNLPKALAKLAPAAKIEIVEINPGVVELAKEHFSLRESDKLKVIIEDGIKFAKEAQIKKKLYDLIILDAFDAKGIPAPFLTDHFLQKLASISAANGIITINTIQNRKTYNKETNLFFTNFGQFYNLVANNRVIIAKKGPLPNKTQIEAAAQKWHNDFAKLNIDTDWLLSLFKTYPLGSVITYSN